MRFKNQNIYLAQHNRTVIIIKKIKIIDNNYTGPAVRSLRHPANSPAKCQLTHMNDVLTLYDR